MKLSWFKQKSFRTPTILQMEAVECGAVALGIILAYYDCWLPLSDLRTRCGVSRDGSRADNIMQAAEHYGLSAEAYQLEPEELTSSHLPAIIHWNFNHFLVVEKITPTKVYLNDPALGPRTVTHEEFDEAFTGILLEFKPTQAFKKQGKKPSVLPNLVQRLKHSKSAVSYIMLTTLALAIPGIAIPGMSKVFIDQVLVQQLQSWLYPVLIGLLIAALVKGALTWLQQYLLLRLETKLALVNSAQFFWHLLRLPISFFTQRHIGDIQKRLESSDSVAALVSQQFGTSVVNILLMIIYGIVMALISPSLTLLAVLFSMANLLVLYFMHRVRTDESHRQSQTLNKMMSTSINGIQMIETFKATGAETDFFQKFTGQHANYLQAEQRLSSIGEPVSVLPNVLNLLANAAILGFGGWLAMKGSMSIGSIIAFQMLYANFNAPITHLVQIIGMLQELIADLFRIEDVMNHQVAQRYQQVTQDQATESAQLSGDIEMNNITFGYSPLAEPLLKDFSLRIKPGQRIALVGGSGSGKSTVAKLLAGHYQPWSGEIKIDGIPYALIPHKTINRSIAIVDQAIHFFSGSIKENLTLWDEAVDDEVLTQACKDALIHEEISSNRPKGYLSDVQEDGQNFSGGQRQRLELARALTMRPSVLVLDEATSALDTTMEKIIDSNIRKTGCAMLIISHRLSTIRDSDEIIVLDAGQVIERGTHESLLEAKGLYHELLSKES